MDLVPAPLNGTPANAQGELECPRCRTSTWMPHRIGVDPAPPSDDMTDPAKLCYGIFERTGMECPGQPHSSNGICEWQRAPA
jgi:hypothetical protein